MSPRVSPRAARGSTGARRSSGAKAHDEGVVAETIDGDVAEAVPAEVEASVAAGEPDSAAVEPEQQPVAESDEPQVAAHDVVAEDLEVADTVGEHPAPVPQRETPRLAAHVDEQLVVRLAREALAEVTAERTIGALRDVELNADEAAAIVRFSNTQGGYPGWYWTVAVSTHEGVEPSVLEAELLPYEGALTAPDWVPWADRLEDYVAQQDAEAAERAARGDVDADAGDAEDGELDDDADDVDDESDDDSDEHDDDSDDDDDDDDVHEHDLHLDDVDGVDIDLHGDDEEE